MKKRITALAVLLLAVSLVLSSCSLIYVTKYADGTRAVSTAPSAPESTDESDTVLSDEPSDPETPADRAKARLEGMPAFNFDGQSFIIVTTGNMTFATDGDDYYDRVLLQRDSIVEEKYDVDIITVYAEEGRIEADLKNAALSGEYYADMISVPEYRIGRLASEGLIMNLRSLPFYTTANSYSRNADVSAAGNAIYADIGAASCDFSKIYAVFFNRSIAESIGFDLDGMTAEGSWTWDSFDRAARAAAEKLGVIGQGSALMGNEYTDAVFRSSGEKLISNPLGALPTVSFSSARVEELVALACDLIYGNPSAYKPAAGATESDFLSLFASGQLFMAIAPLSRMAELSIMDIDWGVVPIPKLSESQEYYYGYTEASANVIAVPSENNKFEMTGVLIGALNAASYDILAEEYKNNCLYNYFRSSEALTSLDAVLESITFDFSYLYASGASLLADATYGAVRTARTSATEYATDLINDRKEAANAQLSEFFGEKEIEDDPPIPPPVADTEPDEDTDAPEIPAEPDDTVSTEDSEAPNDDAETPNDTEPPAENTESPTGTAEGDSTEFPEDTENTEEN